MKTIYQFVYCADVLRPHVVWYSVAVGSSERSRRALKKLEAIAATSSAFLLRRKTLEAMKFQDQCAASLFPAESCAGKLPVQLLRQMYVSVEKLVSFLRECPPAFLNSDISPFVKKSIPLTHNEKKPK